MGWPWSKSNPSPEPVLSDVEQRVLKLESEFKAIRLEWNDAFEKLARLADRIRKRQERSLSGDGESTEKTGQVADVFSALWAEARRQGVVR